MDRVERMRDQCHKDKEKEKEASWKAFANLCKSPELAYGGVGGAGLPANC